MYEAHWGLQSKPFEDTADVRFYYPGDAHQGALLKLRYAVENRRSAALLTGGSGLGKTLLVERLFAQLPAAWKPAVHLVFPELPPAELLSYLADELGVPRTAGGPHSIEIGLRRLEAALRGRADEGRHVLIAIDEAHRLAARGELETLRLLLNLHVEGRPALTLLIAGQTPLLPALQRLPALEERLAVKCLLRPFTADETALYVRHRMAAAGSIDHPFDDSAIDALAHLSQGVPRRINRLADLALLVGFAEDRPRISAAQVEAVCEELVAVHPE